MKAQQVQALKSALRHFVLTAVSLYLAGVTDLKALGFATAAAIVGPAIRGIDKNDPAFGRVADWVTAELDKLAKKDKKKTTKTKKKA
jgi:flagellar biosynthesis component FlhA